MENTMWSIGDLQRLGVDFAPDRNSFTYTFPPPHFAKSRGRRGKAHALTECANWPDASLYVHIPFCELDCDFCSLHREVLRDDDRFRAYMAAVSGELSVYSAALDTTGLAAVYIGGGTPSILEAEALAALLSNIAGKFNWQPGLEVCVELAPTVARTTDDWRQYLRTLTSGDLPVTRVSFGAQSFDERVLRRMGRRGGLSAFLALLEAADEILPTYNVDLILGYPESRAGVTSAEVVDELIAGATALRRDGFRLPSMSFYQLWDTGTIRLGREGSVIAGDIQALLEAKWRLQETLFSFGYQPTIVSTVVSDRSHVHRWVKHRHREFRHFGIGSGIYSILPRELVQRPRDIGGYTMNVMANDLFRDDIVYELSEAEVWLRKIIMGLRSYDWISQGDQPGQSSDDPAPLCDELLYKIERLVTIGLIERSGENIRLNESAFFIANELSTFLHPSTHPRMLNA
jgi:coproporphyrinogen III oxidase-like Fe-S oxidoreductase